MEIFLLPSKGRKEMKDVKWAIVSGYLACSGGDMAEKWGK